jgi:acyl-CoA dehydrogenase
LAPFGFSREWYRLRARLLHFMDEYVYPNESTYEAQHRQLTKEAGHPWVNAPILETLKAKAKAEGLWNLFMAKNPNHSHKFGAGLTNLGISSLPSTHLHSPSQHVKYICQP